MLHLLKVIQNCYESSVQNLGSLQFDTYSNVAAHSLCWTRSVIEIIAINVFTGPGHDIFMHWIYQCPISIKLIQK